jgi:DivIVA domain-containing protein
MPPSSSSSRMRPEEVARRTFTRNRRGFDPEEVQAFLGQLAQELAALQAREEELLDRLAEAEERAANPQIDDERLRSALGQKSAEVLRNAHQEAARLVAAAEENANALVRDAQQQATDIQVSAEAAAAERIAQAELDAGAIHEDAKAEVAAILERARSDGNALIDRARERGRLMIEQAQETRRRMLTETAHRRRVLLIQIEQLRAARDQLARTVIGVRGTVDDIVSGLARADDDARAAAAAVAERVAEVEAQEVEGLEPVAPDAIAAPVPSAPTDGLDGSPEPAEPPEPVGPASFAEAKVEELFARIREGHQPPPVDVVGVEQAEAGTIAEHEQSAHAGAPERSDEGGTSASKPAEDTVDARLAAERDALLEPILARMARRLKRTMQDDQNLLLHRLRADAGAYRQELLSSEDDQRRGLVEAAVDFLGDAFDAGEQFARQHLGDQAAGAADPSEINRSAVGTGAQELADTVVTLLRRRLLEGETEGPGPTEEEAAELVSAAYREWRGERIERLAGDHLIAAFSSGVCAASGKVPLRWLTVATDRPCADCADNALAEPVAEGERFPTGHLHPPAHAGCRCLVVPTPT